MDRGIGIEDPRWRRFENFLADMGEIPEGYTLERIENDRGYCKDNCRWATNREQSLNKVTTKLSPEAVRGIRKLAASGDYTNRQIAEMYGIGKSTVSNIVTRRKWAWVK